MSLLTELREPFIHLVSIRFPDGAGGYITRWVEGETVFLTPKWNSSPETNKAQKDGTSSTYSFYGERDCGIGYHQVLKRKRDGVCFRITSPSGESVTPPSSSLNLTVFTAERWELT